MLFRSRFNVSGALLVKLFGRHEREVGAFSSRAGRVRDIGVVSALYGRVFFVALGLVGALGAVAVYGIGAQLVVSGNITAGTLVAMATLVSRVYQPLTGLTNARVDLLTSFVSFDRVFEVLDAPVSIVDKPPFKNRMMSDTSSLALSRAALLRSAARARPANNSGSESIPVSVLAQPTFNKSRR